MPVLLLVHFDGTNGSSTFTDASPAAHPLTPSFAVISTTSPKFGTGSGDFTVGGPGGINVGNWTDLHLAANQFTVEAWAYWTSAPSPSGVYGILTQWNIPISWFFGMVNGSLAFYYSTTGSDTPNVGTAYTPALNTWIHVAADRDASNVLRVYANGVVVASGTAAATILVNASVPVRIGSDGSNRSHLGRLDEVRMTIGQAQYAGPFTPPTAPFNGIVSGAAQARVMVMA
jgi:Concanavalin A-like lectin/glucanases superfamily